MRLVPAVHKYLRSCFARHTAPRVGELAHQLGLAPLALSRAFERETEQLLGRAMRAEQIAHAEELLRSSEMTIEEVAAASGFTSARSFYRAFRRERGVSPGTLRRKKCQ